MRRIIVLPLLMLLATVSWSQNDSAEMTDSVFSLQQAIDYALEHNYDLKNDELEILKARKKVWETTAIGLPQVEAKFDANYMLTVPEALEQFSSIGGLFQPVYQLLFEKGVISQQEYEGIMAGISSETVSTDEIRWGATLDVSVSQLIFNGSYIVGLQASKTYQQLSKYMKQQSVAELNATVTNAYAGVLIAKESKKVLKNILTTTNESIREMEAMHEEGFIENTDVDQLRLTAATIETTLKNLELQAQIAKEMLKMSIGMDLESPLSLSDDLNSVMTEKNVTTAENFEFDVTQNINYQLLQTQEELKALEVKNAKAEFLPTVAAYYNHQENFNDNSFVLQPPDVVGVNVTIPIFSSWSRMSKVKQRKIELEQTQNDKANAVNGLKIQHRNTLNQYLTALNTYKNNKSNMELAKRIYDKTREKYKEGVSSSFDLSQSQSQYLQAQSDYFQSIMKLIEAKSSLDKLSHQYQPIDN